MGIMEYALQIGTDAYEQEKRREQTINSKADYLFKWLTLFIAVFNIAIPLLVKEIDFDYKNCFLIIIYILLMISVVVAMCMIASINFPQKIKLLPKGCRILEQAEKFSDMDNIDLDILYQKILFQDKITEQLSKNNDKAIIKITIANIAIIIAILCLALYFGYIMLYI